MAELTLSGRLREVRKGAFKNCNELRTIYVAGGCEVDLSNFSPGVITVVPLSGTVPRWLRDMREQKDVVIPEGTEKLGDRWFWGSEIESI